MLTDGEEDLPLRGINDPLSKQDTDNQLFKRLKSLAVFNFRAFLNIALWEWKYINQRNKEFLVAITREPIYRKEFTNALNLYLEMGNFKYAAFTDAIYQAIFKENAKEYKAIKH